MKCPGDDSVLVLLGIRSTTGAAAAFRFITNPNGLRQEGLFQNISEEQWDWEGIWYTASTIDEQGWVTEIAILVQDAVVQSPITTIPGASTFAARSPAATSARLGLAQTANLIPAIAGHRRRPRRARSKASGSDVVPSLSVSERRPFDGTATTTDTEPSLDVFYKPDAAA